MLSPVSGQGVEAQQQGDEGNAISWTGGVRGGSFRFHHGGTDGIACPGFVWAPLLSSLQVGGRWSRAVTFQVLSAFLILTPYARFSGRSPRASFRIPHPAPHPPSCWRSSALHNTTSRGASASASHNIVESLTATNGIPNLVGQHASPVLASHQGLTAASTAPSLTPLPYNPPTGTGRICR